MTDLNKYFKTVENQASSKPVPFGAELVAEEYRGFLISRAGTDYLLYAIETKEGGVPPLDLRGSFTTKSKAQAHIDYWCDAAPNIDPFRRPTLTPVKQKFPKGVS